MRRGVAACRLLAITPADLVRHLAVETIFFLGILKRVKGLPTPFRSELSFPTETNGPCFTHVCHLWDHRNMLATSPLNTVCFWTQRHGTRSCPRPVFPPGIQEEYVRLMLRFAKKFQEVFDLGKWFEAGVIDSGRRQARPPLAPPLLIGLTKISQLPRILGIRWPQLCGNRFLYYPSEAGEFLAFTR